jgi:leader peptidase (prepilin peptidase) / N-methyltransferase
VPLSDVEVFHLLENELAVLALVAMVLGCTVGSFLNVVCLRLPKMMEREWREQCCEMLDTPLDPTEPFNLAFPPSRCPQCGHSIRAWENIPVVSYLLLRGRCAGCQTAISKRYPIVEASCGLLSAIVAWHFGFTWQCAAALALTWTLLTLSIIDFDTQLLPDDITLALLWAGLLLALAGVFTPLRDAVIGAAAGYLVLWCVYWIFKLVTGREGMGYGDFKLLAALGAWMGWQAIPQIILLSSMTGAVFGITMIIFRGRDRQIPMPFGPYLATAGWISLLWGSEISRWYMGVSGLAP